MLFFGSIAPSVGGNLNNFGVAVILPSSLLAPKQTFKLPIALNNLVQHK